MKKLIIPLILGLLISTAYAYRISKPQRITDFDDRGLVVINDNFEKLWDITNGRISLNNGATPSTGVGTIKMGTANPANSAGFLKISLTNGTTVFLPYFSTDVP